MNGFEYKGYTARIIFDADDEMLTGTIAGIRDCVIFQADSVPALKKEFHDAVDDYLQSCAEVGKAPDKPASGRVLLRIAPRVHAAISAAADSAGTSLNKWAEGLFARECGMAL